MTRREFAVIEKKIQESLPEFIIAGPKMLLQPIQPLLRFILFDPSGFDKKGFYIDVGIVPLYIPMQYFGWNFGTRIRDRANRDGWQSDAPNLTREIVTAIKTQAIPYLAQGASLGDFIALVEKSSRSNPHVLEALGYSLIKVGRYSEAQNILTFTLDTIDLTSHWQREIHVRVSAILEKLCNDVNTAQAQLAGWEKETLRNLKLDKIV